MPLAIEWGRNSKKPTSKYTIIVDTISQSVIQIGRERVDAAIANEEEGRRRADAVHECETDGVSLTDHHHLVLECAIVRHERDMNHDWGSHWLELND